MITAEFDPLRDQGVAYADGAARPRARRSTARTYDGMFHGFFSMVECIDAGKVAFDDAVAALRAAFARA